MKRFSRWAVAGVVAVLGAGVGATSVSAYSISGGAYVGAALGGGPSWVFDGAYTAGCPASGAAYSGTATGAASTSFTPYYGGAGGCDFYGLPATAGQSGSVSLEVISGPDINGYYYGELTIPSGTSTVVDIMGAYCTATISGPQTFRHGISSTVIRMANVGSDATLEMDLNGIAYTATGPCFPAGTGGMHSTNGVIVLPGVTIS